MQNDNHNFKNNEAVSLRDYFEAKLEAVENATNLARIAMETRLQGMNEFRDSLRDQAAKFLPREEYEISRCQMVEELKGLRRDVTKYITREEYESSHLRVEKDVQYLRESKASLEGKASQGAVYVAYILAVISMFIAAFSLLRHW